MAAALPIIAKASTLLPFVGVVATGIDSENKIAQAEQAVTDGKLTREQADGAIKANKLLVANELNPNFLGSVQAEEIIKANVDPKAREFVAATTIETIADLTKSSIGSLDEKQYAELGKLEKEGRIKDFKLREYGTGMLSNGVELNQLSYKQAKFVGDLANSGVPYEEFKIQKFSEKEINDKQYNISEDDLPPIAQAQTQQQKMAALVNPKDFVDCKGVDCTPDMQVASNAAAQNQSQAKSATR